MGTNEPDKTAVATTEVKPADACEASQQTFHNPCDATPLVLADRAFGTCKLKVVVHQWIGAVAGVVALIVDLSKIGPRIGDECEATNVAAAQLEIAVAVGTVHAPEVSRAGTADKARSAIGRGLELCQAPDATRSGPSGASTLPAVTTQREASAPSPPEHRGSAPILPPPGVRVLPGYDRGWVTGDGRREPFVSYVDREPSVNWSDELEALHEEASRTHFIDRWTRQAILGRIRGVNPTATIVDVGCSTGYLLEDLHGAFPRAELVGIDLVAAGLAKAHEAVPDARLLHADACALPLRDASVDAVVSANLLEHVADDLEVLREIARVLRPGGQAAIVVPAGPRTYDYYDRFLGHQRRYARGELASKCLQAGLDPLDDLHIGALLYPAFWLVKQRNRLRFGDLQGEWLEARVAADIARTHDSRGGRVAWWLEVLLVRAGIRLPFGIRSLVVARRGVAA